MELLLWLWNQEVSGKWQDLEIEMENTGKFFRRPLGTWKDLEGTQALKTGRNMTLEAGSRALV